MVSVPLPTPAELTADRWRSAGRALIAKAIAQFCYEELLSPVPEGAGRFRIDLPGNVAYRFTATRGAYESWFVVPGSVNRRAPGADQEADDALRFVVDARETLGLSGTAAGRLIRELNATLAADVKLLAAGGLSAGALADLPYERLEGYQSGRPWIEPARFPAELPRDDTHLYPPEAQLPIALAWIAARRDLATYRAVPGLTAEKLYSTELDSTARAAFTAQLTGRGLDPNAYRWLPIHPRQWEEVILPLYTGQVADRLIVPLGEGPDYYLAQRSVRGFANATNPRRREIRLPASIRGALCQGPTPQWNLTAPAVTAWLLDITRNDAYLTGNCRLILLGEVASVSVAHPVLDELPGIPFRSGDLLGAVWREPLAAALESGERARPLDSLLQVDPDGRALLAELVARSGLHPAAWLARLFAALLPPLLHLLYRYGVAVSPQGANAVVVYDGHDVPVRLAVKDFADDVIISNKPLLGLFEPPREIALARSRESAGYMCRFLHAGLFVRHFRYLAELAERQLGVRGDEFWRMVRAEILSYQQNFSALAERFATFDLFTRRVGRLWLDRERDLLGSLRDDTHRDMRSPLRDVQNPLYDGDE
jgi:siderophore synthetase component